MTQDQIEEKIRLWVYEITGVRTILSYLNADRPALPYLMLQRSSVEDLNEHAVNDTVLQTQEVDGDGVVVSEQTLKIETEYTFMLFAYGDQGQETLRVLASAMHSNHAQESLYPELSLHGTGPVNDIPELVGEVWEERREMTLRFRGTRIQIYQAGDILSTEELDLMNN